MHNGRIYCSGPLFCAEEVGGMSAIAQVLEKAGYTTFVPHRDGLEPYVMRFGNMPTLSAVREQVDYAIFSLDVYELLERCQAVVCNLNGRVPDEGMIVEASLAYAAGKPVVLYKNDVRAPFGGYDNAMLTSLVRGNVVNALTAIPKAVVSAAANAKPGIRPAGDLERAVDYGRRISSLLQRLPQNFGKQQWPEEILQQVLSAASEPASV